MSRKPTTTTYTGRLQIYLRPADVKEFRNRATVLGLKVGDLGRRLIEEYLADSNLSPKRTTSQTEGD